MCFFCCDSSGLWDPASFMLMCTTWPSVSAIFTCNISVRAKNACKLYLDITVLADFSTCMGPHGISVKVSFWCRLPLCKWGLWLSSCGNFSTMHTVDCSPDQLYLTFRNWNIFTVTFFLPDAVTAQWSNFKNMQWPHLPQLPILLDYKSPTKGRNICSVGGKIVPNVVLWRV